MNFIKDNLIMILAGLALVLGLGWAIDHYRASAKYAKLETKYDVSQINFNNAAEANKTNQTTIADLKRVNKGLVDKQRADQAASALAAERQVALTAQIKRQLGENARLRDKLAQENPDVRSYLDDGMPCELARSLWPTEARPCKN